MGEAVPAPAPELVPVPEPVPEPEAVAPSYESGPPATAHGTQGSSSSGNKGKGKSNKGNIFDFGNLGGSVQRTLPPAPSERGEKGERERNPRDNHRNRESHPQSKGVMRDRDADVHDPDFRRAGVGTNSMNPGQYQ